MKLLSPKIHAALFALAFAFWSPLTFAQTVWTDATGDWFTPGNWSLGVPNSATDAQINNTGMAQVGGPNAQANSLTLGLNAADSGTVSVTGSLTVTNQIIVGDAGTGTMNVTSGGTVSDNGSDVIGFGGTGTVTVSGAGSTWTNSGVFVGDGGTGTLNIMSGGVVTTNGSGLIGFEPGSGTVTVDGTGSKWTINGGLMVGDDGMATLNITGGATVSNTSEAIIGDGFPATVTVNASTWTNSADVLVGEGGGGSSNGTLNIMNGGTVSNTFAIIGDTGPGTVTVDGAGSTWTNTGLLTVGENGGTGTLNITNGAMVSSDGGEIGNGTTGTVGTVTVDGKNSTWNAGTGDMEVADGIGNQGTLSITNGGTVSSDGGEIGNGGAGTVGKVTVDGMGSTWNGGTGEIEIADGIGAQGTLSITNGGTVSSDGAEIGDGGAGTVGTVTVDGKNSTWNDGSAEIEIADGIGAHGTLTITNGAVVTTGPAEIGDGGAGTVATVTVDGSGSTWNLGSGFTEIADGPGSQGTVSITHGGTVTVDGAVDLGDGGTGTVTVDGAGSSWTSGTLTVGDGTGTGTLSITNGGTASSNGATIGNGTGSTGTVTVDGTGSAWTVGGSLFVGESGTGTLNITGGGTVSSNGADIGEGSVGTVTVDGAGSTWTNTGSIEVSDNGTGTLNITNGGVVTTDSITISNGGTVIDDASLVSPDVEINGGLLRGTGTVTGNVFNNSGTVAPGDAPGTLTITGNYTQASAGTLQIQIGGAAAGQHDLLAIGGKASLDGTLQFVRLNNFTGAPGDKIIFLTAAGGVTGTFATVNTGTIVGATLVYEADDVALEFQQASFSLTGMTINQRSVADELNKVLADPREAALIAFLSGEPLSHIPHDLDLIAPEELASIYEIGFSQAGEQNMNLMHRMDDIRAGSTGYSGPVAAISTGKDEAPISDKNVVADKNPVPAFVPCPENRWGVFVIGSGDFVNVGNDDDNAHGYDITTGSVLVGADYRFGDHVAIGIDGEYDNSVADLVDGGRIDADGGKGGAFATVYGKGWFGSQIHVDLAANGGWNSYDTRRIGLQDEDVRGSTDGAEFNGLLSWGSEWTVGHLKFGTWSSLQYTYVQFNSFTEHGSLAPLELPDQDQDSLRSTTGVRASYDLTFGRCGVVRPEVRAAWQHEYDDRSYPLEARLASGAGDLFPVWGPVIGRDAALVDAGVTVQWNARFSAFVFYDGVIGRSNYDNNAVSGGLQLSF